MGLRKRFRSFLRASPCLRPEGTPPHFPGHRDRLRAVSSVLGTLPFRPVLLITPAGDFPAARQRRAACYRRKPWTDPGRNNTMRITLVGSRHFGVTTLEMLRQRGVDIVRVVVADADDRLATAARAAGITVTVQADPRIVVAAEIGGDSDLIVTAHSHARISKEALATSRLGGIGYHQSLLQRHRGIARGEWTI